MPNSKHTAKENVMGSGAWDSYTYTSHLTAKAAAGKSTFDYTDQIRSGQTSAKANSLLDPKVKAGDASPFAGKVMREVVISDEHPNPTPIAIVLDVTGSNYTAAVAVHAKLPQLFGLLLREGGLDLDEVEDELHDAGFDATAIRSASKTLALVGPGGSGGAVAKTDGSLGLDDSTGTDRL
ncbi:hypothetical protein SEA_YUCCA_263 [Mycobacterium phage Yucca]|nr:hypothetical protein SEA_YUCCA_263 [Mycobacterium phage Yucca]